MSIECHVNPKFKAWVRRNDPETMKRLEENLLRYGQDSAIIVDENGDILDGHSRFEILEKHNITPSVKQICDIGTDEDKEYWVLRHQTDRRNLDKAERDVMIVRAYEISMKREKFHGNQHTAKSGDRQSDGHHKSPTASKVAKDFGVSTRTVERAVAGTKTTYDGRDARLAIEQVHRDGTPEDIERLEKLMSSGATVKEIKELGSYVSRCARHERSIAGVPKGPTKKEVEELAAMPAFNHSKNWVNRVAKAVQGFETIPNQISKEMTPEDSKLVIKACEHLIMRAREIIYYCDPKHVVTVGIAKGTPEDLVVDAVYKVKEN